MHMVSTTSSDTLEQTLSRQETDRVCKALRHHKYESTTAYCAEGLTLSAFIKPSMSMHEKLNGKASNSIPPRTTPFSREIKKELPQGGIRTCDTLLSRRAHIHICPPRQEGLKHHWKQVLHQWTQKGWT